MPAAPYYRDRPARFWIALMAGPSQAAAADLAAAAPPSDPHLAAPTGRQRTPGEDDCPAAASAAWEAWAGNWFHPDR